MNTELDEALKPRPRPRPELDPEQPYRPVYVQPSRFVTIPLASAMTGLSPSAIRTKISRGVWVQGREYTRAHGHVLIDMKGYERWVETAAA